MYIYSKDPNRRKKSLHNALIHISSLLRLPKSVSGSFPFLRGASINYVDKQMGREGSPKCQQYYFSLFSKLGNEVGEGASKILKILSTKFMNAP